MKRREFGRWLLTLVAAGATLPFEAIARPLLPGQRRTITVREFLTQEFGNSWQPWEHDGIQGHGVLSLPGHPNCDLHYIQVAKPGSQPVEPSGINVDTIRLNPGDTLVIGDFSRRYLLLEVA